MQVGTRMMCMCLYMSKQIWYLQTSFVAIVFKFVVILTHIFMKSFKHLWLLIVASSLCASCLCDDNPGRGLCIDDERVALLQFKHDLIDDANRLSSWSSANIDCCTWDGIVCDNFTGHVQELHLRGPDPEREDASTQLLRGNINHSLLLLKQLKYLDLSCNDFGVTQIPSFIGSLRNLRYLNLSMSQFFGEVPHQLGNLSMLVVLDLGNGPWLSNIPMNMHWLSSLRLLKFLDLSGYDLNSASDWFQVVSNLPSLVELHLPSSNLTQIPNQLSKVNFTSLTVLDLSYNIFDTMMPWWIFSLNKLVSLDLTRCLFHGPVPSRVGGFQNMTDLKVVHVSENDCMNSTSVLSGLLSVTSLVSLDISTCSISTPILGGLQNTTSLVSIDLSQNFINETLPNSVGNLCNLRHLDLRSNNFTGSVSELLNNFCECNSPKLDYLAFSANSLLWGRIPDKIGQLRNLVTFDLAFNSISGTIPNSLGKLSSLKELMLNVNLISGTLPDTIGNLTSLEKLEISFNKLSGSLPKSFGKLRNLIYMSVHHNLLTGDVTEDHFANLTALTSIRAEANRLTLNLSVKSWTPPFKLDVLRIGSWNLGPRFPSWIQSQGNLTELDISNTGISDIMPSWFWSSYSEVIFLNISHNSIRGTLVELSILAPNAVVDLSNNRFEGPLPGKFNDADFVLLDASYNHLSGSLEKFLCPRFERDRPLIFLDLANNNLSGVIPDCWMNWQALSVINFENNNLSGGIPKSIESLSSIQSFNVRNNDLSGKLPAFLLNSKSLEIIELAENKLTGSIPLLIDGEKTKLKLLSLRSNMLAGEIPEEFCRLTSIQILDLAYNNLSGTLPTCFYNFSIISGRQPSNAFVLYDVLFQVQILGSALLVTKGREFEYRSILGLVTTLDLSSNKFSGPIPKELMGLAGLRWLNLSGNHLTGRIPEEIGKMTSLESLDLSLNQLEGKIPWIMSRLTTLNWLNLSSNKLTGEIPTSTQLQSFNETSFMSNTLCGPPLAVVCNNKGVPPDAGAGSGAGEQTDDESDERNWGFIISIVLGFIIGFWAVVAPLIASKVWRNSYFNFLYSLWLKICLACHKNSFRIPPS